MTCLKNKVEKQEIDALMKSLEYKFERVEGTAVTACWSFLSQGFQVGYGQSACVDISNFNEEIGKKIALENCMKDSEEKLWNLEGYCLYKKLTQGV